jgi:hypothetical protein
VTTQTPIVRYRPLKRATRRLVAGLDILVAVGKADFARVMIGIGDLVRD